MKPFMIFALLMIFAIGCGISEPRHTISITEIINGKVKYIIRDERRFIIRIIDNVGDTLPENTKVDIGDMNYNESMKILKNHGM